MDWESSIDSAEWKLWLRERELTRREAERCPAEEVDENGKNEPI
jgi:hypothetical protein